MNRVDQLRLFSTGPGPPPLFFQTLLIDQHEHNLVAGIPLPSKLELKIECGIVQPDQNGRSKPGQKSQRDGRTDPNPKTEAVYRTN